MINYKINYCLNYYFLKNAMTFSTMPYLVVVALIYY